MKLNKDQKRILAEIFGNIAAIWFAAGVVPVFFATNLPTTESFRSLIIGLFISLMFSVIALFILKR